MNYVPKKFTRNLRRWRSKCELIPYHKSIFNTDENAKE